MLNVRNLCKNYMQGERIINAVSDVTIDFENNGLVSIIGESGSGKTTFLNLLGGLESVTAGEIILDGKDLSKISLNEDKQLHAAHIGFVFQDYNVLENMSVYENVRLSLELLGISEEEKDRLVKEALSEVGLAEYKESDVNKLSGGQKQRVAIARAYVKKPRIILADEPTGNLDSDTSKKIFELLKKLSEDTLVIVVTHNSEMAKQYSDRMIRLADGKIVSDEKKISKDTNLKRNEYVSTYKVVPLAKRGRKSVIKSIMFKRKCRVIVTSVIFAITIFMFMVTCSLVSYDENVVINEYMNKYDENAFILQKEVDDIYETTNSTNIVTASKQMYKELEQTVGAENVYFTFSNLSLFKEEDPNRDSVFADVTLSVMDTSIISKHCGVELLTGTNVIITDYLAEQLELVQADIGKKLYLDDIEVTLYAILDTDYEKQRICRMSDLTMEQRYIFDNKYNVVYISKDYMSYRKTLLSDSPISMSGNNFFNQVPFYYINETLLLGNETSLSAKDVIGQLPNKCNEIVISWEYACKNLNVTDEESAKSALGKIYNVKNLYSEEYGEAYIMYPNLYDYCGENVCVVGIVSDEVESGINVWLEKGSFTAYEEEYYDIYSLSYIGVYADSFLDATKKIENYKSYDPNVSLVYNISEWKTSILSYIIIVLVLMAVLTTFMFISLIAYNIKDNEKKIGILKALGITNRDIKKVFLFEPMIIILISNALAVVAFIFGVKAINSDITKDMVFRTYDIYVINWLLLIGMIGVMFVYGRLCVSVPIHKTNKKTIMETIRQ